jgi:hypothetical protein
MVTDGMEAIGTVRVIKRSKETGEVVFDQTFKNQITNFACGQVALMWTGQVVNTPTMIAVGTGSSPSGTAPSDSALWAEVSGSRKTVDYAMTFLNYYTQYSVTYQQTDILAPITGQNPTGQITLTEAGLFDVGGNLWSHVVLNGVTHDNTTTLSIQWQVLQKGN